MADDGPAGIASKAFASRAEWSVIRGTESRTRPNRRPAAFWRKPRTLAVSRSTSTIKAGFNSSIRWRKAVRAWFASLICERSTL